MSDQFNSNNPSADVMADAVAFSPDAVYTSKFEYYRDMRNPRYKSDPLYRLQADEKAERSFAGMQIPNVKVYDKQKDHRQAAAYRNPDGSIDAGETTLDNPTGAPEQPTHNSDGLPYLIEKLPGGGVRVRVSSTRGIPKDVPEPGRPMTVDHIKGR